MPMKMPNSETHLKLIEFESSLFKNSESELKFFVTTNWNKFQGLKIVKFHRFLSRESNSERV